MTVLNLVAALILATPTAADDKESLQQAAARLADADSYRFKGETEFQSQFGNAPPTIPTLDGTYQKDAGLYIKSDKGELFKKGDRVLIKQGAQGEWTDAANFQPPTPPAGANPNRPRLGGGGGMFGKMMLRNVKAPHEEIRDVVKGLKTVKKDEKTEKIGDIDCTQYACELTDEAMKASPLGRILTTFGGANAAVNGTARFWVDTHGNIIIYEVVTKATIEIQGNQIDFSLARRSELMDLGKAKVEVPEAVQKLLTEKPKPEKSEDKKDQ